MLSSMKKLTLLTLSLLGSTSISLLHADEVLDAIKEATEYYQQGNYTEASGSLNMAVQLINDKASKKLAVFLPKAPSGWEMAEPEFQSAAMSLFGGGGNVASATYTSADAELKVSIAANSPVLQTMMMFLNNPAFLASSGKKVERIGGQRALVEWDGDSGNINVIVAGSALVTVEGYGATFEQAKALAEAVSYRELALELMQ
jgi:hypothetical protein